MPKVLNRSSARARSFSDQAHQRAHFGRMQALDRMLTRLGMAAVGFTVGASAVNSCIYDGILPILLQARWFLSAAPLLTRRWNFHRLDLVQLFPSRLTMLLLPPRSGRWKDGCDVQPFSQSHLGGACGHPTQGRWRGDARQGDPPLPPPHLLGLGYRPPTAPVCCTRHTTRSHLDGLIASA